ncbi:flagellar hook-basal body protein [Kyrpidia tusciae]|uniref:Fagellar hook-basal body protein n=1 Tax=Kyrpidia tusciae (strain DSM 2912 / NBRC 15312 / T2) TaxID=562970 RepID=D5WX37_KYRT2|nr:flagellar hook-basal body protein [Kyrpidia tusciae]ADG07818.1 fagellar hook-basal body protein [Kyrpidia tusciae DSM 2912]
MIRGLYIAASGMIAQQRREEIVANNLVNASTPGYKQDEPSLRTFGDLFLRRLGSPASGTALPLAPGVGPLNLGATMEDAPPRFTPGPLVETKRNQDFALIDPPGRQSRPGGVEAFFAVEGPNGQILLTRDGQFIEGPNGQLYTGDGYRVLAAGPNGQVIPGSSVALDASGAVHTYDGTGAEVFGGLAVLDAPVAALQKQGTGVYVLTPGAAGGLVPSLAQVRQGFLEQSNVDPGQTMVQMIDVVRAYEANQKVIRTVDQSMDKLVNQVGRVNA